VKITNTLRKEINAAVRRYTGANPLAEVGLRGERPSANALLWLADDDLYDVRRLATTREIADDPTAPGCAVLDLYVTTGIGINRELETNVYIAIRDGHVIAAHHNGRKFDEQLDALAVAFPRGAGWLHDGASLLPQTSGGAR